VNCLFGILHGEGLRKEDDDEEPGIVDEPGILSNMVGCLPSQQPWLISCSIAGTGSVKGMRCLRTSIFQKKIRTFHT
jgi:hypothetical protein